MAVHLIGGGWAEDESAWTGLFVEEARARIGRRPLIRVVLWAPTLAEGESWHQDYTDDLTAHDCTVDFVQLDPDRRLRSDDLRGADGIFVGGGLTPGYHAAILPAAGSIRDLVAAGVPYAGFSAGAMIAGRTALLGGWRSGGVPVCPEAAAEGLDELALAPGLGLVEPVVDAHAAQAGTLSRAVAVVAAGLATSSVAIDECTSVRFSAAGVTAHGLGRAVLCTGEDHGLHLTVLDPSD